MQSPTGRAPECPSATDQLQPPCRPKSLPPQRNLCVSGKSVLWPSCSDVKTDVMVDFADQVQNSQRLGRKEAVPPPDRAWSRKPHRTEHNQEAHNQEAS